MTIRFAVRHNNPKNAIYIRLSAGGDIQAMCSTDIWIPRGSFSHATKKMFPSAAGAQETNTKLKAIDARVSLAFNEAYGAGEIIDTAWLRTEIDRFHKQIPAGTDDNKVFFSAFLSKEDCRAHSLRRFKKYETKKKLMFSDITPRFASNYIKYLETVKPPLDPNTINLELMYLRSFLKKAYELDDIAIVDKPWPKAKVPAENKEVEALALLPDEVMQIYNHDFSNNKKLQNVQTLFLIGIFTGSRFDDLHQFTKDKIYPKDIVIGEGDEKRTVTLKFISVKYGKTNTKVTLPVHPILEEMLNRNFRLIRSAPFGRNLKDMGEVIGLDRSVFGKKYGNRYTGSEIGWFPLHQLLRSHVMRYTFGTSLYGVINTAYLSKLMGHSGTEMTEVYINLPETDAAVEAHKSWGNV